MMGRTRSKKKKSTDSFAFAGFTRAQMLAVKAISQTKWQQVDGYEESLHTRVSNLGTRFGAYQKEKFSVDQVAFLRKLLTEKGAGTILENLSWKIQPQQLTRTVVRPPKARVIETYHSDTHVNIAIPRISVGLVLVTLGRTLLWDLLYNIGVKLAENHFYDPADQAKDNGGRLFAELGFVGLMTAYFLGKNLKDVFMIAMSKWCCINSELLGPNKREVEISLGVTEIVDDAFLQTMGRGATQGRAADTLSLNAETAPLIDEGPANSDDKSIILVKRGPWYSHLQDAITIYGYDLFLAASIVTLMAASAGSIFAIDNILRLIANPDKPIKEVDKDVVEMVGKVTTGLVVANVGALLALLRLFRGRILESRAGATYQAADPACRMKFLGGVRDLVEESYTASKPICGSQLLGFMNKIDTLGRNTMGGMRSIRQADNVDTVEVNYPPTTSASMV
jgi:hypothetical protein